MTIGCAFGSSWEVPYMEFAYPVSPNATVTQNYYEHQYAAKVNGWTNYNPGIDWAVPTGTPAYAAQIGKIKEVRRDATGYGVHVRIQHDGGYETIYAHLMDYCVNVGDLVVTGQQIGRTGNTGNSTGPHIHFELRHNGKPIDPDARLSRWPAPAVPPTPVLIQPGQDIFVAPGYNLRAGPGVDQADIGSADLPMAGEIVRVQGDWALVQLAPVWVHQDGLQG